MLICGHKILIFPTNYSFGYHIHGSMNELAWRFQLVPSRWRHSPPICAAQPAPSFRWLCACLDIERQIMFSLAGINYRGWFLWLQTEAGLSEAHLQAIPSGIQSWQRPWGLDESQAACWEAEGYYYKGSKHTQTHTCEHTEKARKCIPRITILIKNTLHDSQEELCGISCVTFRLHFDLLFSQSRF